MTTKTTLSCIAAISLINVVASAQQIRIDRPMFDSTNTAQLFIDAIELGSDSTTITFRTYNFCNGNIRMQPTSHLVSDGKSYNVRNSQGIVLGKRINIPALSDSVFSLSFDPLPLNTKTFDFIEGTDNYDFKIEGIHTDKSFDSLEALESIDVLPQQKWEKGIATLNGKILNYNPENGDTSVTVYPRSALGAYLDKTTGTAQVDSTGNFTVSLPIYQSFQPCFLNAPGLYTIIYLSPGTESTVTIDAAQRLGKGHAGTNGSVTFSGANCEINNQLSLNIGHDMMWDSFSNNMPRQKTYTSARDYKDDVMRHGLARKQKIAGLPFTPIMRQLLNIDIDNDILLSLLNRYNTPDVIYLDSTYFDFLRQYDIDNPMMMWAPNYDSMIEYLSNIQPLFLGIKVNEPLPSFYQSILDKDMLTNEESELIKSLMNYNSNNLPRSTVNDYASMVSGQIRNHCDSLNLENAEKAYGMNLIDLLESKQINNYNDVQSLYLTWSLKLMNKGFKIDIAPFNNAEVEAINGFREENMAALEALMTKYADLFKEILMEYNIDDKCANLENYTNTWATNINQLFAAQQYSNYIGQRNVIDDSMLANCHNRLEETIYDFVLTENETMEKILHKSNINILSANPESSGDMVIKEIAEKFKGKVIYIDIWATWCTPCLHAITDIEPVKKEYAGKVAFVYLADEESPKKDWDEKIKSINGEHMRLNQVQMREIMSRFGFSGYPSYIVIGKDGNITYAGHLHELDKIRNLLNDERASSM